MAPNISQELSLTLSSNFFFSFPHIFCWQQALYRIIFHGACCLLNNNPIKQSHNGKLDDCWHFSPPPLVIYSTLHCFAGHIVSSTSCSVTYVCFICRFPCCSVLLCQLIHHHFPALASEPFDISHYFFYSSLSLSNSSIHHTDHSIIFSLTL